MEKKYGIKKKERVQYGQKSKVYNGLRPFMLPPIGYKRITKNIGGEKVKLLTLDKKQSRIIKEGLELLASGELETKDQIYLFLKEKGLKSNSKWSRGVLQRKTIDRILNPWNLLIYTGNISYPQWGINEVVPAKHPAIISWETRDEILKRL